MSVQTHKKVRLREWQEFIRETARGSWSAEPITESSLHLTIVYLADEAPLDIDNVAKPVIDALNGLLFEDDALLSDMNIHRRFLSETFDAARLPSLLAEAWERRDECVYVRLADSRPLEDIL